MHHYLYESTCLTARVSVCGQLLLRPPRTDISRLNCTTNHSWYEDGLGDTVRHHNEAGSCSLYDLFAKSHKPTLLVDLPSYGFILWFENIPKVLSLLFLHGRVFKWLSNHIINGPLADFSATLFRASDSNYGNGTDQPRERDHTAETVAARARAVESACESLATIHLIAEDPQSRFLVVPCVAVMIRVPASAFCWRWQVPTCRSRHVSSEKLNCAEYRVLCACCRHCWKRKVLTLTVLTFSKTSSLSQNV